MQQWRPGDGPAAERDQWEQEIGGNDLLERTGESSAGVRERVNLLVITTAVFPDQTSARHLYFTVLARSIPASDQILYLLSVQTGIHATPLNQIVMCPGLHAALRDALDSVLEYK